MYKGRFGLLVTPNHQQKQANIQANKQIDEQTKERTNKETQENQKLKFDFQRKRFYFPLLKDYSHHFSQLEGKV